MTITVREPPRKPNYLTREGYNQLKDELEYLRHVKRKELAERLHESYEGDGYDEVSEPVYDSIRNEQAFIEGRIIELECLLANPVIIDGCQGGNEVQIGATVTIQQEGGQPEVFKIVGPGETSPREGRISYQSPLGSALIGRCPCELIRVSSPGGEYYVQVLSIATEIDTTIIT